MPPQIQDDKFKKAVTILKEKGVIFLIEKGLLFTKEIFIKNIFYKKMLRKIYFPRGNKSIIKKLKNTRAMNESDYFDFITTKFCEDFLTMQIKEEFVELLKIFKKAEPKIIMEIGTANGGTLFCFSKLAPSNATIISIDLPEGKFGGGYAENKIPFFKSFAKDTQRLFLLREDSHMPETLKKVEELLKGGQIDFLFIDGDHSYGGVKKDFEMYSSLVQKNAGVVAFHDIAPKGTPDCVGGVPQFWAEIKDKYQFKEFIKDPEQTGFGIGVLFL